MTHVQHIPHRRPKPRFTRLRRFASVVGLCAVVLPITGFWVDVNDDMRGISAIRMRVAHGPNLFPAPTAYALHTATGSLPPLSLDRSRYRATLRAESMIPGLAGTAETPPMPGLLALHGSQVSLALADGSYLPLPRISKTPRHQTSEFWSDRAAILSAEERYTRSASNDARWLVDAGWEKNRYCNSNAEAALAADMQRLILRLKVPFTAKPHPKSGQYMEMIDHAATRFGLSPQLIYAIMRTESAFNPFAVSNAGALGLMQVVPESAGNEVRTYLTGKAEKPTTAMLFDPQNNIEYGSAYLHLLATRYFSGIVNQTSRELCMIAGYNAGPRSVLRVFSSNTDEAVAAINALSPEELFQTLSRKMPAEETRQYVGKVISAISSYPG